MFCIDSYVDGGKCVKLVHVTTGVCEHVFIETAFDLYRRGFKLVFRSNETESGYIDIFDFASKLFRAKGFSANVMDFNNSVLILVSVNEYKDFGQMNFLSMFNSTMWSADTYAVALGDYRNFHMLVDIGLRR